MACFLAYPVSIIQRIVHFSQEILNLLLFVLEHNAQMNEFELIGVSMLILEYKFKVAQLVFRVGCQLVDDILATVWKAVGQ